MLEEERMCVEVEGKLKAGTKIYMRRKQNWTLTGFTAFSPPTPRLIEPRQMLLTLIVNDLNLILPLFPT
jgi:hypothetical protein